MLFTSFFLCLNLCFFHKLWVKTTNYYTITIGHGSLPAATEKIPNTMLCSHPQCAHLQHHIKACQNFIVINQPEKSKTDRIRTLFCVSYMNQVHCPWLAFDVNKLLCYIITLRHQQDADLMKIHWSLTKIPQSIQ